MFPAMSIAQVDSVATDSLSLPADSDSLQGVAPTDTLAASDSLVTETFKAEFKVRPWDYHVSLGAHLTATDSTLRWLVVPGWMYKKNRDPGVISFRMGTVGRTNAMQIHAQEARYQQLYWEGIR